MTDLDQATATQLANSAARTGRTGADAVRATIALCGLLNAAVA